jgi:chromosome segregation ATPase
MKIEELEDDIHELQTSLQETSTKLAIAKGDSDTYKRSANTKQKELDELKDTFNVNSQVYT